MPKPLVTIVMPIYRVEEYIAKSVESVIAQTYDNIELILVDDGSPDKSSDIAEKILKENSFPYKLIKQENSGVGYARNAGIRNSSGEWIVFLDPDDILLPNAINNLLAASCDESDFVFSRFNTITLQTQTNEFKAGKKEYFSQRQIQNCFLKRSHVILAAGTLFRREPLIKQNILFDKIPWSEDQHFIWRLLAVARGAVFLDEPLYQYLTRPGSIMTSSGTEKVFASYPAIRELPKLYGNNKTVKKFLVARWVLGTVSSLAKNTDYGDWLLMYKRLNTRHHMITLLFFPSLTTRLRALICLISKRAYYSIFRKRI